jgi:hypothetical protein
VCLLFLEDINIMANYHGILQGGTGSFSVIKLGDAGSGASAGTAFITSSDGGVDIANINMFTASYAKITELDVVTLNSITQTQENLNISASLIVASDGAASTNEADGSGLYISGANASFTWDDGNSLMSLNKPLKSSAAITAGTSFIIGNADLNEADMEKLDGITNGTVAASKAVVVDANADASGFRNVTGTGAITAGTSFIIGSADLNEADMEKIDGITNGTVAASKAVVVDSNKDASGFRNVTLAGLSGSSTLQAVGATTLGSTLSVSGAATIEGAVSGAAGTFDALAGTSLALQSGGITAAGAVAGATTITSTGLVSGSGGLVGMGATTLGSTLKVSGAATFGSYISASSYVSASSFSLGENSATIEYSDALDLSLGSTKYAALSTDYFSASVELQGPTVHTSGSVTAGTSFIIGSADLNEADLEKLDGITNGTVAASKAVVVDSNKDASGFRNVTGTGAITAGTSFIIGSADLNEADLEKLDGITNGTVAASKAVVVDANSDASGFRNVTGTGAITAGTSFIIGSADLNEADMEKIDGITNGAGAANKALVLDGNADVASGLRSLTGSGDVKFANGHFDDLYVGANSFTIGSTELNESELSVLDSVTAGTVAASKVVVVDANKDIGSFRNVTLAKLSGSSTLQAVGATTLGSTLNVSGAATFASTGQFGGHVTPATDSTYNLGSTAKRWANIYTGDLHLKNERGNWTIFEEADHLRVRNNLTGKMYKMGLTPISED